MNSKKNPSEQKRLALVVGINKYEYSKFKNLKVPANNARYIANRLIEEGDCEVETFNKVSRKELKESIVQLFKPKGQHPEMALLYFSGYVLVRDEGIKEVFLTTSDSNPSEDYELGVSLRWLKQLLEESLVQQQIIIFDCYYNEEHNLHIDNLIPGYQNNKDRCFLILFNKNIQDFVHKKDERVCSFFTNAIINILKLDEEEGINCVDSKILIKSLKDRYENRLKKNGYYKRISFGKRIHILGEPPDNSKVNSTLTHNQSQRKNPYKGLASFRYEDAEYFYGRQKLTDELLEKVRNKNFLAVMGALGSGKSSAIRAGLIYQITLGNQISGSEGWITIIFQPGMRPFQSLAEALAKALLVDKSQVNDSEFQRTVGETREFISQGSDALQQLIRRANTKRVVLVVDQFEEVFTDCHDHNERENFFECLLGALSKIENNKLCLVLAIRGDYFGRCAEREYYGLARKIQQHLVAVTPMSDSELQEAIEEPANELGVEVDEKLTRKLIKEVKNKLVGLPLLQYYLQKNWNENEKSWQSENSITLIDRVNKSLGRVIEEDANYVYDNLQENERPVARYIFLKLTYLGEGTGDSRKKVYADKLENTWRYQKEDIEAVKQKLIDNQLIIAYKQITDEGIEVEFVNLIHDALISHWSKLRFWLGEYRVYSKLKEDIEEKSKQWKAKKYDISYLYVGKELEETEKLINNYGDIRALKKLANEFIAASKKLRDEKEVKNHQEEQKRIIEQKRINRNNRLTIIGIVILVVFFIVVIIINSLSLERASIEQNKRYLSNQSVALTRYSKTLFNERRQFDALIEGLRAVVPLKKQELPLPNNIKPVLRQAVDGVKERNRLEGHTGSIYNVGFSPDGKILASGSLDKSIKLWNVETGEEILPRLKNHKRKVYNVSFNPQDKTQLASSSADGTIRLWNLETGEYKELIGHKGKVYSLSFTQDGEILASTGLDKTIKLWNAKTGEEIFSPLTGHKGKVYSVSFNPKDKTQLASGSADGTVRLWNISTGESKILSQRNYNVYSVCFSPDGKKLASGSTDGTTHIWNFETGQELNTLNRHKFSVNSVIFSPDSQILASGSFDNTIKLWDVTTGKEITTITGHKDWVYNVSFYPKDGKKLLASGSADGTIRLWDIDKVQTVITLTGHNNWVNSVIFNPQDDKQLASASVDGTIKLWNVSTGKKRTISTTYKRINSVSFSHDGRILASSTADGNIQLWNTQTLQEIEPSLSGHNNWVNSLSFNPKDSTRLASGSNDETIKVWDIKTGKLIYPPLTLFYHFRERINSG